MTEICRPIIKRKFKLQRCNWKGWEHFEAKVLWSVIDYNTRVAIPTLPPARAITKAGLQTLAPGFAAPIDKANWLYCRG